MKLVSISVCIICITFSNCADSNSYEINQIEFTPLHDAIIFNDIADIMNEIENSMNPQLNKLIFSGSESDEDTEDLLSEYQHYLDKAHKQRIDYKEKSKGKNKVPMKRQEKYTKMKQSTRSKYNGLTSDFYSKYTQNKLPDPLHLFMMRNAKLNKNNNEFKDVLGRVFVEESPNILMQTNTQQEFLNLPPKIPNSMEQEPIFSSCYCKPNQNPCQCSCKQCFILNESLPRNSNKRDYNENIFIESFPEFSKYTTPNKHYKNISDKLNIRIKIDVQLPKLSEVGSVYNYGNQAKATVGGVPAQEMISNINLPFPYLNFPIPMELLGQKKMYYKHNSSIHKTNLHKKKKSRLNNNNKRHNSKKIITFHTIKDQTIEQNNTKKDNESNSISSNSTVSNDIDQELEKSNIQTNKLQHTDMLTKYVTNNTVANLASNKVNYSIETTTLTVNVSKNSEKDTNESLKIENSIETDYTDGDNKTTVEPLRLKREAVMGNIKSLVQLNTNMTVMPSKLNQSIESHTKEAKRYDKTLGEMELLYWPTAPSSGSLAKSKNITAMILERETKKAKLNMTQDKIRNNRTMALEHAIFGDVDWNDVDTVAPIFMSFVGKYIRGILTFCSQSVCHSMKCAEKTCLHRICTPDNRFNHKAHCTGNNNTDSVAAMESIMDLPSNVGFEIVDILQDKMLGKMYGKATLCIISKCSTFVASKKFFQKSKCIYKELSLSGHCPIVKNVKII